jgi:hypothetical protein
MSANPIGLAVLKRVQKFADDCLGRPALAGDHLVMLDLGLGQEAKSELGGNSVRKLTNETVQGGLYRW